jgi:hypothetical protein
MNLFVPDVGAKLVLKENWDLILYDEYRNESLIKNLGFTRGSYGQTDRNHLITIPKDTILTVKRVYIRQGLSQYSSLTFAISKKDSPDKRFCGVRFWASLNDVNQIKFELKECNEDLLKAIDSCLYDIKEKYSLPHTYKEIESLIIESGNVNTFRPIEDGYTYFRKAVNRVKERINVIVNNPTTYHYSHSLSTETLEDVLRIMNVYFRKFKIAKMIEDDSKEELVAVS